MGQPINGSADQRVSGSTAVIHAIGSSNVDRQARGGGESGERNRLTTFSRSLLGVVSVLDAGVRTTAAGRMPWFEKSEASAAMGPAQVPRSEHSGSAAGAAAASAWCMSHVTVAPFFPTSCTAAGRWAWAAQQSLGKSAEYDATWHRSHAIVQLRSRARIRLMSTTRLQLTGCARKEQGPALRRRVQSSPRRRTRNS
jgi:hypothetical protein